MKKLIFILLMFPAVCCGQFQVQNGVDVWVGGDTTWYEQIKMDFETEMTLETEFALMVLFKRYQQECYNDSTEVVMCEYQTHYPNSVFLVKCDPGVFYAGCTYVGERRVWTHREPTFNGFMDFILGNE